MRSSSTRGLRENLRATMARAARREEVIVTRRGGAYVRLLPAAVGVERGGHPLRRI